ncbi:MULTISPECIES: ribosome silencing factor [Acidithrix]|uniref:Ribosomal silencing factor RsfS n=1 Tax=Acidithrix ferrooxidans TaxID=1280514 RepID=A0A0D8HLS1_9ACTN|nr:MULTISPECIES: ribosome silencing factor [Acidithrix]KJF18848.1 ribosomal silencing factor RsfS [Acidithrix ferrooxidans]CAG4921735.1 unnamed protein product [Acidithrix sp. C25]
MLEDQKKLDFDGLRAALVAGEALSDKKGEELTILDISELSTVCDYFVIASGNNSRQVRSLAEEVEAKIKVEFGIAPRSIEGLNDTSWVLMDYSDFVVHIFMPETRDFYSLERLWMDAKRIQVVS